MLLDCSHVTYIADFFRCDLQARSRYIDLTIYSRLQNRIYSEQERCTYRPQTLVNPVATILPGPSTANVIYGSRAPGGAGIRCRAYIISLINLKTTTLYIYNEITTNHS